MNQGVASQRRVCYNTGECGGFEVVVNHFKEIVLAVAFFIAFGFGIAAGIQQIHCCSPS